MLVWLWLTFASIAGAMALQLLFPAVTSAANREMFEGGHRHRCGDYDDWHRRVAA